MRTTWIITSAINSDVGVFGVDSRILQTHATIDSIIKYYPDAKLVLVEAGKPIADYAPYQQLKSRCHVTLDLTGHGQIEHLQREFLSKATNKNEMGGTTGLTKTVAELTIMGAVLAALRNNPDLEPALHVDRIFKISGRYQLSPLFDPAEYEKSGYDTRCVFRQRDESWIPNATETIGTGHSYSSRLWSFAPVQLDDLINCWDQMIEDCLELTTKYYIDIEHLLFKHIGPERSIEIPHTHLYGTIAPTGVMVYD